MAKFIADYLSILEFAYNSSKHSATGFTPFMLMNGFQPRSLMVVGLEKEKIQSVKDFLEDMNDMLKAACESICSTKDHVGTYAHKACKKVTFEKGDLVFLKVLAKSKTMKTGKCDKLSPRYCGPFKVLKKIGDVAYKLELLESSQVHPIFHVSKLKKSVHGLENVVSPDILVDLIEPQKIPYEPKRILGIELKTGPSMVYSNGSAIQLSVSKRGSIAATLFNLAPVLARIREFSL
ncbi:hypothetical protein L7F22_040948 [Adiantum nelumboides]|nr:hypothetical protein [Adiantum nelumboides]